ncbi:MAG: type II secretion system F family protein [Holosporaceae bacterium]|jgi:tight adherence protein B|nr:type II secretion system F family protein [Holosporaceae bacterium]
MTQIINTVLIFFTAFFCFYGTYAFFNRSEENDEVKKKLEERIKRLSKQQVELLESASDRISTFTKIENADFGSSSGSQYQLVDRIALIMRKASITDISIRNFTLACAAGGVAFAFLIIHFNFLNAGLGIPVGFVVGAFLVYNMFASMAAKKKMDFLQLFPDAIDMMIRGVKAGLNVGRIMKLVSIESKDPIASEFRTISQRFDLGVEPEKVLVDAADRVDIEEFRFLVVALVLQMENGGVLAEILQNLSSIIRKRLELGLKLKAMSAEARMSAIVISALPFAFAGIMSLINPNHIKEFTNPGSGQTLLKIAITLFSIGTFMMLKASKIKV